MENSTQILILIGGVLLGWVSAYPITKGLINLVFWLNSYTQRRNNKKYNEQKLRKRKERSRKKNYME